MRCSLSIAYIHIPDTPMVGVSGCYDVYSLFLTSKDRYNLVYTISMAL
nr:MAG TPA: hypothetical protein [Bacteriophage sp.]